MDVQPLAVPTMRSPERWLAVLRIAVGLWFLKALVTKLSVTLLWGFLPLPTASERWLHVLPILVGKYGEGNPVGFFRDFMQNTVIPHSQVFAQLTAFGEVAVGLGLTCGFLTALAAGLGLFLVANYGLAVARRGPARQGFPPHLRRGAVGGFGGRPGGPLGVAGRARRPPARGPA